MNQACELVRRRAQRMATQLELLDENPQAHGGSENEGIAKGHGVGWSNVSG